MGFTLETYVAKHIWPLHMFGFFYYAFFIIFKANFNTFPVFNYCFLFDLWPMIGLHIVNSSYAL